MEENPSSQELFRKWQELLETGDPFYFLVSLSLFALVILGPLYYFWDTYQRYYPRRLKAKFLVFVEQSSYYQNLTSAERLRFEKRVQLFINNKKFISRGKNFHLNDEIIARIAATAVEISFGYPNMAFEHFNRILIYPDDYYSNITKNFHAGEVNMRGFIVLSWKSFQEGYANDSDGINLGIHEMAHALKLENRIKNGDYNFLRPELMVQLNKEFRRYKGGYTQSDNSLLRKYGLSNIHEFFAVLCENFFERPRLLKEESEDIYRLMTQLLLQNPIADYQSPQSSVEPIHILKPTGPIERY